MFVRILFLFATLLRLVAGADKQYGFPDNFDYTAHLGHRRPYYHSSDLGPLNNLPEGCEIVQVHALIRHGARNPTADEWPDISRLIKTLQSKEMLVDPSVPDNPFTFLPDWKPFLHEVSVDQLSTTGRVQAFNLGEAFMERYGFRLFNEDKTYEIEYGDQNRVEETARWFASGFWGNNVSDYVTFKGISEKQDAGARSLKQYMSCPKFSQNAEKARDKWRDKFLPGIKTRLNKYIKHYQFTDNDVYVLYEMCAYETAISGVGSQFCQLFRPAEFLAFEYLDDIWFQQFDGPANKFSAILGAPFVQRMAQRLRSNSSDKLYFSFGHDITVLPVLSALAMFSTEASHPLETDAIKWNRAFRGGNYIPFCGNVVVEKLECDNRDYVRVLSNQIPLPLEGCGVGPSGITDGICELEAFLNQSTREKAVKSGIQWFERSCGLKNDIIWQH